MLKPPRIHLSVDVWLTPLDAQSALMQPHALDNTLVIAVDVLRATSTIISAFAALDSTDAKVWPVISVEDAFALAPSLPNALLAGEVNSQPPEGFDADNSPTQLLGWPDIASRSIIIRSTNGSGLIQLIAESQHHASQSLLWIGSFPNRVHLIEQIDLLWRAAHDEGRPFERVIIACAGSSNDVALEDVGFAGALISDLQLLNLTTQWSDSARLAYSLWQNVNHDTLTLLSQANHSKTLLALNKWVDIEWVAQTQLAVLPFWDNTETCLRNGTAFSPAQWLELAQPKTVSSGGMRS